MMGYGLTSLEDRCKRFRK